jgi:hypothetical protein
MYTLMVRVAAPKCLIKELALVNSNNTKIPETKQIKQSRRRTVQ